MLTPRQGYLFKKLSEEDETHSYSTGRQSAHETSVSDIFWTIVIVVGSLFLAWLIWLAPK
jgi:hypothetical protein